MILLRDTRKSIGCLCRYRTSPALIVSRVSRSIIDLGAWFIQRLASRGHIIHMHIAEYGHTYVESISKRHAVARNCNLILWWMQDGYIHHNLIPPRISAVLDGKYRRGWPRNMIAYKAISKTEAYCSASSSARAIPKSDLTWHCEIIQCSRKNRRRENMYTNFVYFYVYISRASSEYGEIARHRNY